METTKITIEKKNKIRNTRIIASSLLIACSLMFTGCSTRTGKTATNIDASTGELLSQDSADKITDDIIKNIKNIVKNAPSLESISDFEKKTQYNFESELSERKNNFVLCGNEDKVTATDKVNLSFIEISLESGDSTYELNVGYDFDLNGAYSQEFKNALVNHAVGEKITIEKCKMPDGKEAKVKVKINYITRSVSSLDALETLIPEGSESYSKWLESSLKKAETVGDIWNYILPKVEINSESVEYKEYLNKKYNDAYEYYSFYNSEVDKDQLKAIIETQCKKEFVACYYAVQLDVDFGKYTDEEIKNIALYYGYTAEAFKAKYSDNVVDTTLFIDLVGAEIYKEVSGS